MIAEMRAVQADLAARATFAAEGEQIRETRTVLGDLLAPPERTSTVHKSASALAAASQGGFIEVG